MKEIISGYNYRVCPRFESGECCGKHHSDKIENKRKKGFNIKIVFTDGTRGYVIEEGFEFHTELETYDNEWVTLAAESEEVQQLSGSLNITQPTIDALNCIHPNTIVTRLLGDCPFRME